MEVNFSIISIGNYTLRIVLLHTKLSRIKIIIKSIYIHSAFNSIFGIFNPLQNRQNKSHKIIN